MSKSKTLFVVLSVLLAATIAPQTAAAAAAADQCGHACDNQNPNTYLVTPPGGPANWFHCSADARTVDTIGPAQSSELATWGVTIQLRYSPRCRTVWARAFGLQRSDTLWVKRNPGTSFQDSSNDVEYPYNTDYLNGANSMWSVMLDDAGQTAVACFTPRGHGTRLHVCTSHPY